MSPGFCGRGAFSAVQAEPSYFWHCLNGNYDRQRRKRIRAPLPPARRSAPQRNASIKGRRGPGQIIWESFFLQASRLPRRGDDVRRFALFRKLTSKVGRRRSSCPARSRIASKAVVPIRVALKGFPRSEIHSKGASDLVRISAFRPIQVFTRELLLLPPVRFDHEQR